MKLRVATCQFAETWKPRHNAAIIRHYMAAAKRKDADIVHFHECALSGYAGEITSPGYDWEGLREAGQLEGRAIPARRGLHAEFRRRPRRLRPRLVPVRKRRRTCRAAE
jgi:predicted amidohydrolase